MSDKKPKSKFDPGQWWFALKAEDGKGVKHQIVESHIGNSLEDGDCPVSPEIITWSEVDSKGGGGHTWRGEPEEFEKRFKWIGFEKRSGKTE